MCAWGRIQDPVNNGGPTQDGRNFILHRWQENAPLTAGVKKQGSGTPPPPPQIHPRPG